MNAKIRLAGISLLLMLASISTVLAQSQSTTGSIQGTVSDQAGAVIAGATVEVK